MKFSVVIPVYKRGRKELAETCIGSVALALNHARHIGDDVQVEVVIVNDSPGYEETERCIQDIIQYYSETEGLSFKVVTNESNCGCYLSRIHGYRQASGDYIVNLDSDNSVVPAYFHKLLKAAKTNPDVIITTINAYSERGKFWDNADYSYYERFYSLNEMFYGYYTFVDNSIESKVISKKVVVDLLKNFNKMNEEKCKNVNLLEDFMHTMYLCQNTNSMEVITDTMEWCYCDTGNMSDTEVVEKPYDITSILSLIKEAQRTGYIDFHNSIIKTRVKHELDKLAKRDTTKEFTDIVGSYVTSTEIQVEDPTIRKI